jgi:hypothetical protein
VIAKRACSTLLLIFSVGASAESLEIKENDSWYQTVLHDAISPVTTNARYLLLGGSIVTTGFYIKQRNSNYDFLQSELGEDKSEGPYAKIGDISGQMVPNALYTLGMLSHAWLAKSDKSLHRAGYMVRATGYSAILSTILKLSVKEKRPSGGKYSFPSGHTTTAFAFATVIACEHEWYFGIPALGLATFVGLSRMNDNKHYFHDVLAGATIGSSYALGLYLLDKKKRIENLTIYPVNNQMMTGLAMLYLW